MGCQCESYEAPLMGQLMGQLLAAGSQARVGFAFNYSYGYDPAETEAQGAGAIQTVIYNQLVALDTFSAVSVAVQMPQYFDIQDGYITVSVTLKDGQSNPNNIGDMVQYAIQAYVPRIIISRRDQVWIDHAASGSQVQPSNIQQLPQGQPGQPGQCNWETLSFGDYIACQLGITSPLAGVGAGAVGALVGVSVLTLLAVVLLKR